MEKSTFSGETQAPEEPRELEGFNKRLLEKIKSSGLRPRPRWYFTMRKSAIWAGEMLAFIVISATAALMLYLFVNNDWELLPQFQQSFFDFFIVTLPYFWIAFVGALIFLLSYNIRLSSQNYKYPLWILAGGAFIASFTVGGFLYAAGLGEKIDNTLAANVPIYGAVMNRHVDFWDNPASGRLTGIVSEASSEVEFSLIDLNGQEWSVRAADFTDKKSLKPGEPVNIIGVKKGSREFVATQLKPVKAGREYLLKVSSKNKAGASNGRGSEQKVVPAQVIFDIQADEKIEILE